MYSYVGTIAELGQERKARIPIEAAQAWVASAFQNIVGRAPTVAEENDLVNSLRIGARDFTESLAIMRSIASARPAALLAPGPMFPRASAPSPTGPPSAVPSWAWWAGGIALVGLGAFALAGGRR